MLSLVEWNHQLSRFVSVWKQYEDDTNPDKLCFFDDDHFRFSPFKLRTEAIALAEKQLGSTSKEDYPATILGVEEFREQAAILAFGEDSKVVTEARVNESNQ